MDENLRKSLREIQSHPTTGLPHNQQVISTQVETIFMLDKLNGEIKILNKNLENSAKANQRLEQSNYRLQWAMLILTAITTGLAVYPVIKLVLQNLFTPNIFGFSLPTVILSFIAAIITGIAAGAILARERKILGKLITVNLSDSIKLSDSVQMVVKDKEGNIKEERKIGIG